MIENCDCILGMSRLPAESVDCVITSPPYDDIREYNGFEFDYKKTLDEIYRVLKQGGVVVWVVSDQTIAGSETGTSFKQALYAKEIGFNLHDTMIWQKTTCAFPETTRYYPNFEYMFIFSKGKPKTINLLNDRPNIYAGASVHGTDRQQDGRLTKIKGIDVSRKVKDFGVRFNVWNIPEVKMNKTGHPAVFPLNLARDHILSWTQKGDIVMDPFMGSGTTGVACIDTGREFIGFEISEEYFNGAKARIAEASAQLRIIGV